MNRALQLLLLLVAALGFFLGPVGLPGSEHDGSQAPDCPRAAENFYEALDINSDDSEAMEGLQLAELCRGPKVRAGIRKLGFRSMED